MDYLFFIIIVIMFFYHGGKINRLEKLIKDGDKVVKNSQTQATSATINTSTAPAPVSMTDQTIVTPAQPVSTVKPDISSEEMSGRIIGRIGIGAVIIGVAFFLKYAFDNNWVGPSGRVMIGILVGAVLVGIGLWLRKKYLGYSDLLMGGGLAVLYLSVYSAYALYQLIDPMTTFMGMIIVTVIGVVISIIEATQTLSIIAIVGGYLAPALVGVSLVGPTITFTYLTILNGGVLGILVYKKWAPLVLIGLAGTWLHFGSWLMTSYNDTLLVPTLFFILLQFIIFTAASVIRLIMEKRKAEEIDYILLAVTAVSFAAACFSLLDAQYKDFLSLGFALTAVLYGAIALVAYKENPEDRTLNIFLPGLSVAFLTAAIAIEFSGSWVSAWWLIEALVLYIVASKSSSRGYQVMGVVVYILALLKLFQYVFTYTAPVGYVIFFNGPFVMLCLAIAVAYAIAFVYYRYGSVSYDIRIRGISAFVIIANVLTVYALTNQIDAYYSLQAGLPVSTFSLGPNQNATTTVSIAWALYAALLTVIGFAKKYAVIRRIGLILFIITACKVVIDVWNLGQIYRIVSFIAFGVIALAVSFIYVKYRDRLKDIV
ncbi:MAG: DUF2339 domain-containing protein [Patescibacteria group bacterium]|nr:DUF2339 domain-containing protein [Patescibacteria group bacterium]